MINYAIYFELNTDDYFILEKLQFVLKERGFTKQLSPTFFITEKPNPLNSIIGLQYIIEDEVPEFSKYIKHIYLFTIEGCEVTDMFKYEELSELK